MPVHRSAGQAAVRPLPRAQRSMLRIATTISLLLALIPLAAAVASASGPVTTALSLAWVVVWGAAVVRPEDLAALVVARAGTFAAVAIGALVATILLTDGHESGLKNGLNWLPWVYLVAATPRAAWAIACATSAAMAGATLAAAPGWIVDADPADRFFAVTEFAGPLASAAVGIILIVVFRRVLGGVETAASELAGGGPRATRGTRALVGGPVRLQLPVRGVSAAERARAQLDATQRAVVDMLAAGLTPQQIALAQDRSDDAVYRTISAAKSRTGACTIEQLVALAWEPAT